MDDKFEREQRLSCLIQAVQIKRGEAPTPESIVEMAEAFYKFVEGIVTLEGKNETKD